MMLGTTACNDWFRYFAACIVIPGLVSLIWMWIDTIICAYRNRFFRRAKHAVINIWDSLREKLADKMTREDIEKYIILASLYGIRYYLAHNPKFKEVLNEIVPESMNWDFGEDDKKPKEEKNRKKRKK